MEDSAIIELYWRRDEEAVARTREAYGPRLRRLAENIVKSPEDAEECENDTYLRAWEHIPPQRPARFFPWLAKVCRNLALGRLERAGAEKRTAALTEWTAELDACVPDPLADRVFEARELGRTLSAFLRTLPETDRALFARRYFLCESLREAAAALGLSESKAKSSLFRSRNNLRSYLEKEGFSL